MEKYLIDASVMLGFVNTRDVHHKKCKKFFDEQTINLLYFPLHSLFEIESARARRIRDDNYEFELGERKFHNVKFIPIDFKLFKTCEALKLFELFDRLRGMDLIYACIAKINNLKLVTCNGHFDQYEENIDILKLAD